MSDEDTPDGSREDEDTPKESTGEAETPLNEENPDAESDGNWEKRYKDIQSAFTKSQQNNREMELRLARLEGRNETVADKKPTIWDKLNSPDLREEMLSDPGVAVDLLKEMASETANVLSARDAYWQDRLDRMQFDTSPDKGQIEQLREIEAFRDLPVSALREIAKLKGSEQAERRTPPGSLDGGRRPKPSGGKGDVRSDPMYQRIYGKREDEVI